MVLEDTVNDTAAREALPPKKKAVPAPKPTEGKPKKKKKRKKSETADFLQVKQLDSVTGKGGNRDVKLSGRESSSSGSSLGSSAGSGENQNPGKRKHRSPPRRLPRVAEETKTVTSLPKPQPLSNPSLSTKKSEAESVPSDNPENVIKDPALRWENELQDPVAEKERLDEYKKLRRARFYKHLGISYSQESPQSNHDYAIDLDYLFS